VAELLLPGSVSEGVNMVGDFEEDASETTD